MLFFFCLRVCVCGCVWTVLFKFGLVLVLGMEQMEDGEDGRNSKLQLELDDAFRTIHEREMHCQELTWEIKKVRESFFFCC